MHAPGNEEQLKRFKAEAPANDVSSRADVSIESQCGSSITRPSTPISALEQALLAIDLHNAYDSLHLVDVDHNHTTWVMPNLDRERPFTQEEQARLTSAVVFHDEQAWSTFSDEDILVFHST